MSAPPTSTLINLQLGWPSPRLFAASGLLSGAESVLTSPSETASALIYGPHVGHPPLRESIAAWLTEVYDRSSERGAIPADRICVSNGASANLSNALLKFTDPLYTRRVFMVEPTYFLACPIFEDSGFQGRLRGVPEGDEGIHLRFLRAALEEAEKEDEDEGKQGTEKEKPTLKTGSKYPKIYKYVIYTVPTFSNPSGKTMTDEARRGLVRLAREFDALVVSDDVYDFLSWPVDPNAAGEVLPVPPRLVDIDRDMEGGDPEWGNTMSNGSFSKVIGPGVRVGWSESTARFARELAEVGSSSSGGAPSHLTSTFVDKMLRAGALQRHIRDVLVPEYRRRYYALMAAVSDLLSPLGVTVESNAPTGVVGGFFVYIKLPADLPAAKTVAAVALNERKLRVAFGHMFTVHGDEGSLARAEKSAADGNGKGFASTLRLCWAWHEEGEMREGVQRLADTIADVRGMMERGEGFEKYASIGIR